MNWLFRGNPNNCSLLLDRMIEMNNREDASLLVALYTISQRAAKIW